MCFPQTLLLNKMNSSCKCVHWMSMIALLMIYPEGSHTFFVIQKVTGNVGPVSQMFVRKWSQKSNLNYNKNVIIALSSYFILKCVSKRRKIVWTKI